MNRPIALACIALSVVGSVAGAQVTDADRIAVLSAAIGQAGRFLPAGSSAIGFADTVPISNALGNEIARNVGYDFGSVRSARVCAGGALPGDCHLSGVRSFLQVTRLRFSADTAEVLMTLLDETASKRQPIHYQFVRVIVARRESSWAVARSQLLAET